MVRRSIVVGVAVLVLAASAVEAQQRQRGQGQPGQRGGRFGFGAAGYLGLLRMEEVQKELAVTPEQKQLLEGLQSDVRSQTSELFGNRDAGNRGQGGFAEVREKMQEINKKADDMVATILEAKQMARLKELLIQREGTRALTRDDVAKELGLSEDQVAKIRELAGPGAGRGRGGPGANQGERPSREEIRAQIEKRDAEMLAVLTPEQQTKFAAMKGKEFTFPARGPGRGGRGRGGDQP